MQALYTARRIWKSSCCYAHRLVYHVGRSANAVTVTTAALVARGLPPARLLLTLLVPQTLHSKRHMGKVPPRPLLEPLLSGRLCPIQVTMLS